jgi:TolB-like protein/cytochrome c-type biogenesis protein CcmH/NrfG
MWAAAIIAVAGVVAFFATRKSAPPPKPVAEAKSAPSPITPNPSPAAAVAAADKSIAVLPFANRSPDKENEFFTDGVHEDILTNLSNIRELRVVSNTSVAQYRGTTKSMKQIGAELGVAYILEGSVQRVGNKVHVTGQLIDARTDAHLWAKAFDKDLSDIFVIQAELAKAIAAELRAVLSPEEKKLVEQKLTDNPKAYDLYLEAGAELRRVGNTRAAHDRFVTLNQAAVELDPKFAAAWAQLSFSYGYIYNSNWDHSPARLAKAKDALEKVEQLVHGSPLAISSSAQFYYVTGDYARSLEQAESLALLAPNNGAWQNQIAVCNRRLGRWPQAIAAAHKAVELDREGLIFSNVLLQTAAAGRRFSEAEAELKRWLRAHPDSSGRNYTLARVIFHASGSPTEAEKILATVPESYANSLEGLERRKKWAFATGALDKYLLLEALKPNDASADWSRESVLGVPAALVRMVRGDVAGAREKLADVAALRARTETEPENSDVWITLGEYEALLGNKEAALRCAHRAVELDPESRDAMRGPSRSQALAFVFAWTGDKDRAIAEYARLLRVPTSAYYVSNPSDISALNVHEMRRSPEFFPLRGDPRFEALLNDPKNNAPLF